MKKDQEDEVIKELWEIKKQFSSSCNKNVRQLVQLVNNIAKEQGFDKIAENQRIRDKQSFRRIKASPATSPGTATA